MLLKTSSLNISKAEKLVTLLLVFSSAETCQQSRALLDRIGIQSNPFHPIRLPPYSYGYISVPSHITNVQLDSFLSKHGV